MAGSLNHIVDDVTGQFRMDLIENLGDAEEALQECFEVIYALSGGSMSAVNAVLKRRNYATIQHEMVSGLTYNR